MWRLPATHTHTPEIHTHTYIYIYRYKRGGHREGGRRRTITRNGDYGKCNTRRSRNQSDESVAQVGSGSMHNVVIGIVIIALGGFVCITIGLQLARIHGQKCARRTYTAVAYTAAWRERALCFHFHSNLRRRRVYGLYGLGTDNDSIRRSSCCRSFRDVVIGRNRTGESAPE